MRPLVEYAPAKVNLTLRVIRRRNDGYHEIESLVAFVRVRDRLALAPGGPLQLVVRGPMAARAGKLADNLVLKAVRALAAAFPRLKLGRFVLHKHLPVAAGLGGGSADAAAALRLLARANRLKRDDPRIVRIARKLGADVPVCLDPQPRLMRGVGEILSAPLKIPSLPIVLVNPGIAVTTADVFAAFDASSSSAHPLGAFFASRSRKREGKREGTRIFARRAKGESDMPQDHEGLLAYLAVRANDLEAAAIALAPVIAKVLAALRTMPGCRLARMSGSGATCFGLFSSSRAAAAAARRLATTHPRWWVRASVLS